MSESIYDFRGHRFRFNDPVFATGTLRPDYECIGRLVQVRIGIGAFGSDLYLIRLNDGSLCTFENVWLRSYDVPVPAKYEGDATDVEYTIKTERPEAGFIVREPSGPCSPVQSFSMIITKETPCPPK